MQEQCCCATYAIVRCLSVRLSVRSSVLLLSVLMAMCCKSNISFFLIFAVLVLRVKDCRPYTPFKTVKCVFPFICSQVDSRAKGHDRLNDVLSSRSTIAMKIVPILSTSFFIHWEAHTAIDRVVMSLVGRGLVGHIRELWLNGVV